MRTCVVSIAAALLLTSTTSAQSPGTSRTISVSGSAEIRVTPSLVNLVVGVETRNRSLAAAKAENDRGVQAVVRSMQALGVEASDIQTDYVNVNPDYTTRDDTVIVLRYYTVRKTVAITLKDVTKFERALSNALQAGANHVLTVQFLAADLRKHRDDARARAIVAAREKAEALAREMNARVGKVISINEGGWGGPWNSYAMSWDGMRYGGPGANQVSVQADGARGEPLGETIALGLIGVTASVSVSFELEPL